MENKLPITSVVRSLLIGQEVKFPIAMTGSVRAVVSRLKTEKRSEGWQCKVDVNNDALRVSVKRIG